ncbi:ATP-dependent DNA helicase [Neobacillus piezotolerans]|uniref:ATP-dependent DNA helicase n=1 Tax=Neobacillus piezotolerans TaxID=2259171 RepID=A0A3D8GLB7_9BACI|nr:ATP-dependent DNA helicase RecQ [Neobacillus piezotolerans]RDU35029.1 ATP-dependent DNA helicase [Neobacillus piezotolerans]
MLEQTLYTYFGYSSFRPGQKEVVMSLLNGADTLAMLPTGTGKSLCFQLPGYILEGAVIIVSPLLSLMQDQVEQMMKRGEKRVVALNSFLSPIEKKEALSMLHHYKFIYLSPEMLGFPHIIERLKEIPISLLAIDEAHCISQWGYDFRPDYLKLGNFRESLRNPLTLALTATATPEVRDDIAGKLMIEKATRIETSIDRPNISFHIEKLESLTEKNGRALYWVKELKQPGIIYFSSKKAAEQTAAYFRDNGVTKAMAYHAGMDMEQRVLIQQQFLNGQLDVICATSAFGMGINKENVRYVIHYHMPMQIESYLQEIGRAGRDGDPSTAILLYSEGDEQLQYHLAASELPSPDQLEVFFSSLGSNTSQFDSPFELEQAACASGLSENQWRWLASCLGGQQEVQIPILKKELDAYVKGRNCAKMENIRRMLEWIGAPGCLRNYFLRYFQEPELKSGGMLCCDNCGLDMDVYKKGDSGIPVQGKVKSWKERLSGLLLGETYDE